MLGNLIYSHCLISAEWAQLKESSPAISILAFLEQLGYGLEVRGFEFRLRLATEKLSAYCGSKWYRAADTVGLQLPLPIRPLGKGCTLKGKKLLLLEHIVSFKN